MNCLDYLQSNSTVNSYHSIMNLLRDGDQAKMQDRLAYLLAVKIVEYRCRRCKHHFRAWKNKVDRSIALPQSSKDALKAFLEPSFGCLGLEVNVQHLEGFIGEWLWFFLFIEVANYPIKHIVPPGFKSTDPGGDAFVIQHKDGIGLFFRLWEMKKYSPQKRDSQNIDKTINKAFDQLDEKALQYLARIVSEEETNDFEVEEFIGNILDFWLNADRRANLGVSIVTSANHLQRNYFKDFNQKFPTFRDPFQLMGMITGVLDFSKFSQKVKEIIWQGM